MGRNPPRPEGYHPFLQLEFRTQLEGGDLLVPGEHIAQPDAWARRECLVLVHGFNNTDGEAAIAYFTGFRARQKALWNPVDPDFYERTFGDAFWPGDADWWSFFDKLDFLIYPKAVGTAVKTAQQLADMISSMPSLLNVDFVAHSLGCRVTLEAIALLQAQGWPIVRRVCLMAAAVPSEMLEPGGRLYELCWALHAGGTRIHILHSMQDTVLHYAFPPGQLLAGLSEASDRALGRFGPTPLMPGNGSTMTEQEVPQAAHGDYWGHSGTDASKDATEKAGIFLRLGDSARELGTLRSVGFDRVIG